MWKGWQDAGVASLGKGGPEGLERLGPGPFVLSVLDPVGCRCPEMAS